MRWKFWKNKLCDCELTKKVELLTKELKVQEKETQLNLWKYNQEKERNLLSDSESDYL